MTSSPDPSSLSSLSSPSSASIPFKPRVLLCASGSVATIKLIELTRAICEFALVKVVCTQAAFHFVAKEKLIEAGAQEVLSDQDEWSEWKVIGNPVVHIELRKWADVFVIAPLSANTMGKLANGLSDNLLTCIARAWDFNRPFIVAPAMNTFMWSHPFTAKHIAILLELGLTIIDPISKTLACGDTGIGAMASVPTITEVVRKKAEEQQSRKP